MSILKTFIKNQKGMSITEVMVAAGLISIVALGVATMMQNMTLEQKRFALVNTVKDLKLKIETLANDPTAWSNTINDVSNGLACLKNNTVCTVQVPASENPTKIRLRDASNSLVFDLLDWTSTTGNGFTEAGLPCATFNSGTGLGSDFCPISYRLVQVMTCQSAAATCANPQLKITGRLLFNPANGGNLSRFAALFPAGNLSHTTGAAGTDGADSMYGETSATSDDARYDAFVYRTGANINKFFSVVMTKTGAAPADCSGYGVGTCTLAFAAHPGSWTVAADTYSMLDSVSPVTGSSVKLRESGYYGCTVSLVAFATTTFSAKLVNTTAATDIGTASAFAGLWSTTTATMDLKFNVPTAGSSIQLQQRCGAIPGGTPSAANCSLGFVNAATYGSPYTFASMTCYKLERTN